MAMLRRVARFMGAATAGVASAPSGAVCHASSSTINPREQLSSSVNMFQKEVSSASDLPFDPLVILPHDEAKNCAYHVQEEWTERPLPSHLVFAPAPTEEEVEEATEVLHAALHRAMPVDEPSLGEPGNISQEKEMGMVLTVRDNKQDVRDTSFKPSSSHLGTLAAGGSSVYQAFHMLQSNEQMQGAVKSLACDPALWKAVVNNEKVLELTRSLQKSDETFSHKELSSAKGVNDEINFCMKLTSKVLVRFTAKVLQLMDKVLEIVGSIFGSVEKTLSEEGTSAIDKTVASCVMLAMTVLLVVVIKRACQMSSKIYQYCHSLI